MDKKYEWAGKEFPLIPGVNAISLVITVIEAHYAEGSLSFRDYWEHGIIGEVQWAASAIIVNKKTYWIVSPKLENGEESFWTGPDGSPAFTANSAVDESMKGLIALHIMACLAGKSFALPEAYSGPKHNYSGSCVCDGLKASSKEKPFDWQKFTEGGMFPCNCFECSCGAHWHCIDPDEHRWLKVADAELWLMLMQYNGVAVKQVGIAIGELYLLASLCRMGYVLY